MLRSLSGRVLILTVLFVMLAEVMIFVPSVARFRQDYLLSRLERAQIASLAVLADDAIDPDVEEELLRNAEVYNVVLRRNEARQLMLSSPVPEEVTETYDLREASPFVLIRDAMQRLIDPEPRVIRVIGNPVREAGLLIEVTMPTAGLREAMFDFGGRVLALATIISRLTAAFLFLAVRALLVGPIKRVIGQMQSYAAAPEDARRIIEPSAGITELRAAEAALMQLETQLTGALKQKERLAQLGSAVAKISHDLRNILTSAQLFTDRIEQSEDPTVRRLAPKLVNSISRAINLCESTPRLTLGPLAELVGDVIDGERLAVGEADVSFAEDIPATMTVRADAEQLHRVFLNLVRNARQAIVATGKPGEISVSAQEDDRAWVVRVTDTGPGLPPKARDNLFTPFQGGTTRGGAGLGLAISSELIRGHGGQLMLDDTGTDGTCFRIVLPKTVVSQEDAAE
jgi:signal transduction histidine kinase